MDLYEMLDGKTVKIGGVSGVLVYTPAHMAPNGLFYVGRKLEHIPDAKGKKTKAYQEKKRELKDDYVTELTPDFDFSDILRQVQI